ncbi:MAG: 30S ribosomal protein S12 methylthiotransferase RimO [Cytophagales bacterium]|nr:30S ribosomal protein S12 methylthiotransferase RimO [Cytophagales bacterium]MDW8384163.1 30S ribosomal protein S12 methylthiotransferase RimO [Flammeovirgaceae bacterium]
MKTKKFQKDKVNIITLGCSKNLVDSENILTQLRANQIETVHESKKRDANIIIINTCGFIENAKQESIDTILRFAEAKEKGKIEKLYVTGCLSQRYKNELEKEIPQVDAFFGTNELPALLKKFKADYKHELLGERITTTPKHYAFLKISEGCDRPCSFCAIPLMRGRHVSRPMEELVSQAHHLAKNGVKEILLIAQDSTYYGIDLYKKRALAELLERLADVEGIEWIRLHYAFPTGFPEDVLDVIAKRSNICKYLDIPLQHASTRMLKIMRRGITKEKTEELIAKIRQKVPGITLRTTMIAGHAGETEADFLELLDFIEKMRFERLGVFTYSHEEQTYAFSMEDNVPEEVKRERAEAIMELQQEISAQINQEKVGTIQKVLFDRKEGGYFIGRTEADSPEVDNEVLVDAKNNYVRIGDFANVKITHAEEFDLFGDIVK